MAYDELADLKRQLAEQQALVRAFQTGGTTIKVSAKRGVSVYGLGKYPVTLYKTQWLKLLSMADTIRAFINEHDAELPVKGEDK
jgi:hypothetical protein